MKDAIISQLKKNLFLLPPVTVVLVIIVFNYTPGTWLSGWDNLHPEMNFGANIKRAFFSAWQEYQGLGLLAGMAHAADLFREIFLWICSFIIPDRLSRYFYHFLMMLTGTVGAYFLCKHIMKEKEPHIARVAGASGGLFYLLNLGSIQYFFVPFEPFSTFWGLLPWQLYTLLLYLESPSRKTGLFFVLASIAGIAQAYVQTIFVVYIICISIILIVYLIQKRTLSAVKTVSIVPVILFCINAFWLLPQMYFAAHDVSVTQDALQNTIATERFFEMNRHRGNFTDFVFLKGMYYDLIDFNTEKGETQYMMHTWHDHLESLPIILLGYVFFALIVFGFLGKSRYRVHFLILFCLSALIFLSDTPLITKIQDLFRSIPIINQLFRNAFTKFIAPASLVFAIGFSMGIAHLLSITESIRAEIRAGVGGFIVLLVLMIYAFPVFQGYYISPHMRVTIPDDYFALFEYFQEKDPSHRIMNLPQDTHWGWGFYTWGARGSGFLWYGIEQPILDRAFDVWSKELEGYYWELSYALKINDMNLFNQVIEKYHVKYVLFDESYRPSDPNERKKLFKQADILDNNPKIAPDATFGDITVYKTMLDKEPKNNIIISDKPPSVTKKEQYSNIDQEFSLFGPYYEDESTGQANFMIPFGSFFTNRFQHEHAFSVTDTESTFILSNTVPQGTYDLVYPRYDSVENLIPVDIYARRTKEELILDLQVAFPEFSVNSNSVPLENLQASMPIELPERGLTRDLVLAVNNTDFFRFGDLGNSRTFVGSVYLENIDLANFIRLYTLNSARRYRIHPNNMSPATLCATGETDPTVTSSVEKGRLTIQSQNSPACSTYTKPIDPLFAESLFQMRFTYQSKTDEYPRYCYWDTAAQACLNQKDEIRQGFSQTDTQYEDFFVRETQEKADGNLTLLLEEQSDGQDTEEDQITYTEIELTVYPLLFSQPLILEEQENLTFEEQQVDIPAGGTFRVTLPKASNSFARNNLIQQNKIKKDTLYHTSFYDGEGFITFHDQGTDRIVFESRSAHSTYWIDMPELLPKAGYIVSSQTRHETGFPLLMTISPLITKEKYYVNTLIPNSDKLQTNYHILPPFNEFDKGLQVSFLNESYNTHPTVNVLSDISVHPFPYRFLSSTFLKQNSYTLPEKLEQYDVRTQKLNYGYYLVEKPPQKSLITLSQGYHNGWEAYSFPSSPSLLQTIAPFAFGNHAETRVRVNNWATGWLLPEDSLNESIVLVFLPQYLQYIGFGFYVFLLILYVFLEDLSPTQKHRHHQRRTHSHTHHAHTSHHTADHHKKHHHHSHSHQSHHPHHNRGDVPKPVK